MTGEHMEKFFLQHRGDAFGQRRESRMAEHGQLIFAVSIDKFGISEKVQPVIDRRIERTQQTIASKRSAFEKFFCFQFPGIAEIVHQKITHLPAVTHFLAVDPGERLPIVFRRGRIEQILLLLDRGKLGVALINDQVH